MQMVKPLLSVILGVGIGTAVILQVQPGPSHTIHVTNPAGNPVYLDAEIPFTLSAALHHSTSPGVNGVVQALNRGDINAVYALSDSGSGVVGRSNGPLGTAGVEGIGLFDVGVRGIAAQSGAGISGDSKSGAGVLGRSTSGNGVVGEGSATLGVPGSGVRGDNRNQLGYAVSGEGTDIGVFAHNLTVTGNVAYLGARCCAGDFYGTVKVHGVDSVFDAAYLRGPTTLDGDVHINGTLTKSAGSFMIDDPIDPTGKYLYHSFVESPDMMNIYNGNLTLDSDGSGWVTLPNWFEALNQDFRYQLTPIGQPAPALYIAQEITRNRFRIAGGAPHGTVSWQVTGVRHDSYANAHRIPVEMDKPAAQRGTLTHLDAH